MKAVLSLRRLSGNTVQWSLNRSLGFLASALDKVLIDLFISRRSTTRWRRFLSRSLGEEYHLFAALITRGSHEVDLRKAEDSDETGGVLGERTVYDFSRRATLINNETLTKASRIKMNAAHS